MPKTRYKYLGPYGERTTFNKDSIAKNGWLVLGEEPNPDYRPEYRAITSIVIPDSVTVIGFSAFKGCSSLTSVTIPDSITAIGHYSTFKGWVNIVPMNDKTGIEEVWSDIDTNIPVSMPNGKDTCWLHASKDNNCGDYCHFGRYFRVPENAMPDNKPLHFWIGFIHYDNPHLHGMYIWLCREDGRNAPTICGIARKGNDYHIPIETTDQVGQIIQQMIDDILGSIT